MVLYLLYSVIKVSVNSKSNKYIINRAIEKIKDSTI